MAQARAGGPRDAWQPDAIVLDLTMPVSDGYDLLEWRSDHAGLADREDT